MSTRSAYKRREQVRPIREHDCFAASRVIDSRPMSPKRGAEGIRRRRRCLICGERFTTEEVTQGVWITQEARASLIAKVNKMGKAVNDALIDLVAADGSQ